MSDPFLERVKRVKLFALDVDGVLTDGGIYLGNGEELKRFDTRDGAGLVIARNAGYHLAIITGRRSESVARRMAELGITEVHQGVGTKLDVLKEVAGRLGLQAANVLFMGDDLPDLPAMMWSGLAVAPFNAVGDVKKLADHITEQEGGRGAVREVVELVLRNQGRWEGIIGEYIKVGDRIAH